jgi:hypothetical protein
MPAARPAPSLMLAAAPPPPPSPDLVRTVRSVLDAMGPATLEPSTDALNRTTVPKRFDSDMRIDRCGADARAPAFCAAAPAAVLLVHTPPRPLRPASSLPPRARPTHATLPPAAPSLPRSFTVEKEPLPLPNGEQLFYVKGGAIERFAQMTNWDYYEAVKRCGWGFGGWGVGLAWWGLGVLRGGGGGARGRRPAPRAPNVPLPQLSAHRPTPTPTLHP